MSANVMLKALGLNTQPNQLDPSSVPPGSLTTADNVIIKRDNVVESRRGYHLYGEALGSESDRAIQLAVYRNRILRYWGTTLEYDTGSIDTITQLETFDAFDGVFDPVTPGLRPRFIETKGNMYFNTNEGVQKICAANAGQFTTDAGFITEAGGINALDFTVTLDVTTGSQGGFLEQDGAVAYRVLWNTTDANNNLVFGAPSQREIISNPLQSLLLRDYMALLAALDNTANNTTNPSLLIFNQFIAEFGLPSSANAVELQAALIKLAIQLDESIVYASENAPTASIPLQLSGASISGTVAAVAFTDASPNPQNYLSSGQQIELMGFAPATGTLNGTSTAPLGQTISTVYKAVTTTGTTTTGTAASQMVTTVPDIPNDFMAGRYWNIYSADNAALYTVWYYDAAADVGSQPTVPGTTTYVEVVYNAGDTADTIAQETVTALTPYTDFSIAYTSGNNHFTITNTAVGLTNDATPGTSTFTITTIAPGTDANTISAIPTTDGLFVGGLVTGTGIPADTYITAIGSLGPGTITISNNATVAGATALVFGSGFTFIPTVTVPPVSITGPIVLTNATINSFTFQAIAQPGVPGNPATDAQLLALQAYLTAIFTALQLEPSSVISAESQAMFIADLEVTTSANTTLVITIPENVTTNYFFQIYRSQQALATGPSSINDIAPNDELQEVYEAYVTQAEIDAGTVTVQDIAPDSFLGAFLYTDATNGTGILSQNQVPPVCKDMNYFENVMFYANTRIQHQLQLNLLGVANMIADYAQGIIPTLVITDGLITNTYTFVPGLAETSQITTPAATAFNSSGLSSYFLLFSAENATEYYVWYQLGTSTDPMVAGATGIEVPINIGDSAAQIALLTANILSVYNYDFNVTLPSIAVSSISVGSPTTVTTSTAHGLTTGDSIVITGSNSTPSINGTYTVTVTGANTFTIPVAVTIAGTTGSITSTNIIIATTGVGITQSPVEQIQNIAIGNPTVITSAKHGLTTGESITISGSNSTPTVNGTHTVTVVDPNNFTIPIDVTIAGNTGSFTFGTAPVGIIQTQAGQGEDATTNTVLLSTDPSPSVAVDLTARSLVHVINLNRESLLYAYYLSDPTSVPGQMNLQRKTFTTLPFYIIANDSATGKSWNPDLTPDEQIASITTGFPTIITTQTPHGLLNQAQVVIDATTSIPNLNGLYTITYISPTSFSIEVTTTSPGTEIPILDSYGAIRAAATAPVSNNEVLPNRIYYSTYLEPEGVPIVNTIDVGAVDKAILRIFPLRTSLFVFKEDGLFRISGTTAPFSLEIFDASVVLVAPDSVDVSNNLIFAWTTKGLHTISEGGVNIISRPIDNLILPLATQQYTNFSTATWGIGYESDNSYTVYTVQETTDTVGTIAFRYSTLTNSWTNYLKTATCGVINPVDDLQYLGAGDVDYIEQERKTFTRYDYSDREIDVQLTAGNYIGTDIRLISANDVTAGDVLVQNQYVTSYNFNTLLQQLDADPNLGYGYASVIDNIDNPNITFTAVSIGAKGNLISLVFNGIQSVATVVDAWNAANPTNMVTYTGLGTVIPAPHIWSLSGGGYIDNFPLVAGTNLRTSLDTLIQAIATDSTRLSQPFFTPASTYEALETIDGFEPTETITSISMANPTEITTSTPNNLITGESITISGSNSTPSINGVHVVTVIDSTHFTIPVNVTGAGTAGTFVYNYGTITAISATNPTVVTSYAHGLQNGRMVIITGSNSTPSIDGEYAVTIVDANNFSVPVLVTGPGTTGSFTVDNQNYLDIYASFNNLILTLNADPGVSYHNYTQITEMTVQESIIDNVSYINDTTSQLTVSLLLDYFIGPMIIYKAIPCTLVYSPQTLGDALGLKHMREATMMFENKAFTEATLSFATDLVPQLTDVDFYGDGNGIFGYSGNNYEGINQGFGSNFFGGASNSIPFRTYIPRYNQRCRYLIVQFTHQIAREQYAIFGISLTGEVSQSSRAYR